MSEVLSAGKSAAQISTRAAQQSYRDSRLETSKGPVRLLECTCALPVAGGFGPRGPPGPFPPYERNGFMDRGPPMMDMRGPMMMDMGAALQPAPLCTAHLTVALPNSISGALHLALIVPDLWHKWRE